MTDNPRWARSDLAYCSNVHPGESYQALLAVLDEALPGVREARAVSGMASGLWFSGAVVRALHENSGALRDKLASGGVSLVTLNGFPMGDFHGPVVKSRVYTPDWADAARKQYTMQLAELLAELMPASQQHGTISSVPLGYAAHWNDLRHTAALNALVEMAAWLDELRERTGRSIRLCLEPEPGCVLETTQDMRRLFGEELPRAAQERSVDGSVLQRHLGVCFDVCHQAVMFENVYESLQSLHEAGIAVGKMQISSAMVIEHPDDAAVRGRLQGYAEPRYLHQVRAPAGATLAGAEDLDDALADAGLRKHAPWHVHFHVPVHTESLEPGLSTTRASIGAALDFLQDAPDLHPHIEIETYTWQVLPEALRPRNLEQLQAGIAAEFSWLESEMTERRLLEEAS